MPKRVVILGGGHSGIHAARRLMKVRRPADDLEIALVSSENAEVFHGLMPLIAGGKIEPRHALVALRHVLPGVKHYTCNVERIDLQARRVSLSTAEEHALIDLTYDYLVIALGSVTDLSRFPGLLEHGLQTKTIGDLFHLRDHLIEMLERASVETDPGERRRLLTFVIAGAGFAGVEIGSQANQLISSALRFYPGVPRGEVRFLIISNSKRILPAVNDELARRAAGYLKRTGVDVRLGASIAGATTTTALLSTGEQIPTRSIIVTVGVKPNPVVATLPVEFDKGRIRTDKFCQVPGNPNVYAVGDNAAVPHPKTGESCAPTALYAFTQGTCAADNIIAEHRGTERRPYKFSAFGEFAWMSNTWGVVGAFGVTVSGYLGNLVCGLIFLTVMPSWSRRFAVIFDWFGSLVQPADIAQLKISRSDAIVPLRFAAGDVIIRQGEPGSRFYIVNEGEVEVIRQLPSGEEEHLNRLGPGDFFGEVALLNAQNRNATVRALTDTKVLSIARQDFRTLVQYFPRLPVAQASACRAELQLGEAGEPTAPPKSPHPATSPPQS